MLILSENVLLLLGTKNMHLLKKCAPGDWNTHLPLLLLLPDTTVTCFCCRNYQAKAKSIKNEQHFAAEGLTRKDKLLTGVLLLVYSVTSKGIFKRRGVGIRAESMKCLSDVVA